MLIELTCIPHEGRIFMDASKFAIIALCCSILGLILVFFVFWLGIILCIASLVMSIKSQKIERTIWSGIGIGISFAGIIIAIAIIIICIVCIGISYTSGLGGLGNLASLL